MKFVENIRKVLTISVILFFVPCASYALVDVSGYGGYSFGGELSSETVKYDMNGTLEYGVAAHINTGIPFVLTVGFGPYYQVTPTTYEGSDGKDYDANRSSYGLDAYLQLDFPVLPVNPYAKAGVAIKEELEFEISIGPSTGDKLTKDEFFKSSYYGIGLARTLLDAVIMDLQLFVEYLYTSSKQEDDFEVKGHAVHAGLKLSL